MSDDQSCGVKSILRRMFRKKNKTTQANRGRRTTIRFESAQHGVQVTVKHNWHTGRHPAKIYDLSALSRENSLAPYLNQGPQSGTQSVVIRCRSEVEYMTGEQLRTFLREQQRVGDPVQFPHRHRQRYDAFTEASVSNPIAEQSFDSGLLQSTNWTPHA